MLLYTCYLAPSPDDQQRRPESRERFLVGDDAIKVSYFLANASHVEDGSLLKRVNMRRSDLAVARIELAQCEPVSAQRSLRI